MFPSKKETLKKRNLLVLKIHAPHQAYSSFLIRKNTHKFHQRKGDASLKEKKKRGRSLKKRKEKGTLP